MIGSVPLLALLIPAMPAHADLSEADGMIGISAREVGWAVRFPAQGYTLLAERDRPDGRAHYSLFAHAWIGLNVSFFIEPAEGTREHAMRACQPDGRALAFSERVWLRGWHPSGSARQLGVTISAV